MLDSIAYLKQLDNEIWTPTRYLQRVGARSSWVETHTLLRPLTVEEFHRVCALVQAEKLGAQMGTSNFGFSLGLTVIQPPPFPGLGYEALLSLSKDHLPDVFKTSWDKVWDTFSFLTHTEENQAVLKFCGIKMRMDKSYYAY